MMARSIVECFMTVLLRCGAARAKPAHGVIAIRGCTAFPPRSMNGFTPAGQSERSVGPALGIVLAAWPARVRTAARPPSGPDWVHEIKHDGYRLIVRRDGKAVRLFTHRGHDGTDRDAHCWSDHGPDRARAAIDRVTRSSIPRRAQARPRPSCRRPRRQTGRATTTPASSCFTPFVI